MTIETEEGFAELRRSYPESRLRLPLLRSGAALAFLIATPESGVVEGHRAMIAQAGIDRIVTSSAMNGVPANWIRDSLEQVGLDPAQIAGGKVPMPEGVRAWRDTFSAGQSVGLIERVEPVAELVARLTRQFAALAPHSTWRDRLAAIETQWSK